MTRKRYRLRKEVKFVLKYVGIIILTIVLGILIASSIKRVKGFASACDEAKGYTCSYYEINQMSK